MQPRPCYICWARGDQGHSRDSSIHTPLLGVSESELQRGITLLGVISVDWKLIKWNTNKGVPYNRYIECNSFALCGLWTTETSNL